MDSATGEGFEDPEVPATLEDQGLRVKSFGSPSTALALLSPLSIALGWVVSAEAADRAWKTRPKKRVERTFSIKFTKSLDCSDWTGRELSREDVPG